MNNFFKTHKLLRTGVAPVPCKSRALLFLSLVALIAFGGFAFVGPAHATTITLGPGDADWISNQMGTLSTAEVIVLTGILGLTEVYKQDEGDANDSGTSAGDYTTTFPNMTEDAKITWEGPEFLDCTVLECVVLVKDGTNPIHQLFNVGVSGIGWDGKMTIDLIALWPDMGSVSHVTIYTALGTGAPIPEPSTILLLGSGLVGLIGYRMKKKA